MKRIFIVFIITFTSLMAELNQVWATPQFVEKKMKIIDIRTPAEWRETGIIEGSYTIMFFDEKGNEISFVRGVTWISGVPTGNDILYK